MTTVQKKFGSRGLSHSATHHLLAVSDLMAQRGYARVSDIARKLGITRGSVSVAMQSLRGAGYVTQDESHFFHPTEKGVKAVASIRARHEIVERFLAEVLGLSWDRAHRESCRFECVIEDPTALRLASLVRFWQERGLEGVLDEGGEDGCPMCGGVNVPECPCCELECIEDSRGLADEPPATDEEEA